MSETFDVAIVGSSPNALVAAARLAGAGRRVVVVDEARAPGGPAVTEELAPGFFADAGVMSAALDGEVVRALGLSMGPQAAPNPSAPGALGLEKELGVIARDTVTALTGSGARTWRVAGARRAGGEGGDEDMGSRGRAGDSDRFPALTLPGAAADAVEVLRAVYSMAPPNMPVAGAEGAAALAEIGARLTGLGGRGMREVLRLLFLSARDFLEETVVDPVERGVLAAAAVRAMSAGPFAPGTLFGLLHHEALGDGLCRCTARGGLSGMVGVLLRRARDLGADVRSGVAGPLSVVVEDGAAAGVRLGDGQVLRAEVVISDFDARATFTRLVPPYELEPEVNAAIRSGRYRGSVARVHLALRALPVFDRVDPEALRGTLVVDPDVTVLEKAWDQAKRGQLPDRPYIEAAIPTLADPGLAPEGKHVLSAWVQWVPRGGGDRQAVGERVIERLATFAPGLRGLVEHVKVSLPEDLESRFGLTEGHLYGGEVSLSRTFFLRPIPGYSGYESPIAGLYLGGSAAHPGGYSGRSGWNVAGRLLAARDG